MPAKANGSFQKSLCAVSLSPLIMGIFEPLMHCTILQTDSIQTYCYVLGQILSTFITNWAVFKKLNILTSLWRADHNAQASGLQLII